MVLRADSSRFASSAAFCALVLAFLFMGPSPVRHSAINRELWSVGEIIPPFLSCANAHFSVIDEPPMVRITGQRRPDSGPIGRSSANRDYRMSTYDRAIETSRLIL